MKKKIILFLVTLSFLFSCITSCTSAKLKKKLPQDIKDWFKLHQVLMGAKVPKWIVGGNLSERYCFLRIPEKAQRMYMSMFWKVRQEGTRELFYGRLEASNFLFNGWKTDMGYICLLCGIPNDVRYIKNYRDRSSSNMEGYQYQIWSYHLRGYIIQIAFEWSFGKWRLTLNPTVGASMYTKLLEHNLKLFYPTPDGWDMIGGWVLNWVKNKENLD